MSRKIHINRIISIILLGPAMEIVASYLLDKILLFFPETAAKYSEMIMQMTELTSLTVFYVVVMAPIFEEIIFRLLIMGGINKLLPFIFANIIQALLFGIYHLNVVQGIYAFILGLYIGYIKKIFGNIVYCMLFHMSLNLSGLFVEKILGSQNEILLSMCFVFSTIAVVAIMYKVIKEEENVRLVDCK